MLQGLPLLPWQRNLGYFCTESPISRLVWQIDGRCLGLPGGFRGWPIQWNHAKCCGPTLVAMATKFRLGAEIQSPTGLSGSFSTLLTAANLHTLELHNQWKISRCVE